MQWTCMELLFQLDLVSFSSSFFFALYGSLPVLILFSTKPSFLCDIF